MQQSRWEDSKSKAILALVNGLVTGLRGILRWKELTTNDSSWRERLHTLREQIKHKEQDKRDTLQRLEQSQDGTEMLEVYLAFAHKHAPNDDHTMMEHLLEYSRTLTAENTLLRRLRNEATDIKAEVQVMRTYVQDHPHSQLGYRWLGGSLYKAGAKAEVIAAYREALRLVEVLPKLEEIKAAEIPVVRLELALALHRVGEWTDAEVEYQFIIDNYSSSVALATLYRGEMYNEMGRRADAHKAWHHAARLDHLGAIKQRANDLLQANP